jgi:hypothetical protein
VKLQQLQDIVLMIVFIDVFLFCSCSTVSLEKRVASIYARRACLSSSRNAVSFSSAHATKRRGSDERMEPPGCKRHRWAKPRGRNGREHMSQCRQRVSFNLKRIRLQRTRSRVNDMISATQRMVIRGEATARLSNTNSENDAILAGPPRTGP